MCYHILNTLPPPRKELSCDIVGNDTALQYTENQTLSGTSMLQLELLQWVEV